MFLKLLSAPISLPMARMKFVLQQIADLADQELNDESRVHEQLLLLQVQLEDGAHCRTGESAEHGKLGHSSTYPRTKEVNLTHACR